MPAAGDPPEKRNARRRSSSYTAAAVGGTRRMLRSAPPAARSADRRFRRAACRRCTRCTAAHRGFALRTARTPAATRGAAARTPRAMRCGRERPSWMSRCQISARQSLTACDSPFMPLASYPAGASPFTRCRFHRTVDAQPSRVGAPSSVRSTWVLLVGIAAPANSGSRSR